MLKTVSIWPNFLRFSHGTIRFSKHRMCSSDSTMDTLLVRNKRAVTAISEKNPGLFEGLAEGQHPKYLYFGCSDSRISPELMLGLKPGEMFVHRNVGNCVLGNDLGALAALEFALGKLGIQEIIVAGHYDCGAVRAAMSRKDYGLVSHWIRSIKDVYRLHREELDAIKDLEHRHRRFVELNVQEQCLNLYKTSIFQTKKPTIYAVTFDPANGLMKEVKFETNKDITAVHHVYNIDEIA